MKIGTALRALLLLALCCAPAASAGGMVKFHIPELESAKVGDTVTATLYNDNNLNPALGDLSLYLDWNMEVLKYESSTFEQGRTTNAALVGLHNLNVMAADTTNGFPAGDNPLLVMKFTVVGPGYTPIVIKVDRARDVTGADVSAKTVTSMGSFTGTGTAATRTATPTATATVTPAPATPAPTVTSPATTVPASGATTGTGLVPVTAEPVAEGPATVPFNTGVFSVTPVGNVPVGGIGRVQLVVDNAWSPNFGDTYVDVEYDPAAVRYLSSTIHVSNTTAAARADGRVRVMLGDFRNGYPEGRYALADLYFTPLREGTTPLRVSVDHVRYWNDDFTRFTDISPSASTRDGSISTGPAIATAATLAPVTGNPSVTYATVAPTDAGPGPAVPAEPGIAPVFQGSVDRDTDEYTGVTTKTATPTPTPTATPTPIATATAPPTTLPPTTVTTNATPTPTATPNATATLPPATPVPIATTAGFSLPVSLPASLPLPPAVAVLAVLAAGALALRRNRR